MEDHAAKVSVEEQMQITTIDTLQKDLDHGSSSDSVVSIEMYVVGELKAISFGISQAYYY